jgi:hypothetical protein
MLKTILILVFLGLSYMCSGQDSLFVVDDYDIKNQAVFLPVAKKTWKFDNSLSLAIFYMPTDWLEQSLSIPMFDYKANLSLGKGFSINTHLKTLVIANDFRLGASWNHAFSKHLHVGVGYQFGYNYGVLNSFGYDNSLHVVQHHPIIRVGFEKNNKAFTLIVKSDIIGRVSLTAAEDENIATLKYLDGYSLGLFFEQRIFKKKAFFIGAVANFNQFHILGWPAFNTVRKLYFIPEINLGFNL